LRNPLIAKLEQFVRMSADDKQALQTLASGRVRKLEAREDVIREGANAQGVSLILSGWASRYKTLEDGRRQTTSYLIPGDICDLNIFILREMDHSIGTLTPLVYADISREQIEAMSDAHPRIAEALRWDTLVQAAIQREWIVNLGQRTAVERVAHLFCEMYYRLRVVGLTRPNGYTFPPTQAELADATGLSTVHVNRTLQDMRAVGLIRLRGREITIPDLPALEQASLFSPSYLHLDHAGARLDANEP
jgi:CRP-like cAMP-binding protein